MQSFHRFASFAALLATMVFCGSLSIVCPQRLASQDTAEVAKSEEPALNGLDPVALADGKELPGDNALALDHRGFHYRFATEANRNKFEQDPSRYEIQRDGHCGAMPGVPGNPALFAVVQGRIYIFGSPECRTRFIADPAAFLKPRRNVAIVVFQGVELLDFAGPSEVFAAADQGRAFNVYTVASAEGEITSQGFLTIRPQYTLANCPKPELIVVPGGSVPLDDERLISWIQSSAPDAEIVMSVCNGALLLARAGLLDGLEATTHWSAIDELRAAAPRTTVHEDRRFLDNGKIVTTAGVSAGIDGALHVVDRILGRPAAAATSRYMEYLWEPDSQR